MQCTLHCKCTMQCTVHFIITLFNVGNVLLCVIYQLNFTTFMYVTPTSRYIQLSVLSAVSHNRGRSWNALSVDVGTPLYVHIQGDQKVSVHLMITVQNSRKNILNSFKHLS
jgi:hypothetical protein